MLKPEILPSRRSSCTCDQHLATSSLARQRYLCMLRHHPVRTEHRPVHRIWRQRFEQLKIVAVFEEDWETVIETLADRSRHSRLMTVSHSTRWLEPLTTSKASPASPDKIAHPARPRPKPSKACFSISQLRAQPQQPLGQSLADRSSPRVRGLLPRLCLRLRRSRFLGLLV